MMMRQVLVATIALLGESMVAHADILAAGGLYGGPTQSVAVCYVFNAGTAPVTFSGQQVIRGQLNNPLATDMYYDDCGSTLGAGRVCGIGVKIKANQGYACMVGINGSKENVRGGMETRDSSGHVLSNSELR